MSGLSAKASIEQPAQLAVIKLPIKRSAKQSSKQPIQQPTQSESSPATKSSKRKSRNKKKKKKQKKQKLELAETKETNIPDPLARVMVETKRTYVGHPPPILCCPSAFETFEDNTIKLHSDPNRKLHEAIYRSFIAFAARCHRVAELTELIQKYRGTTDPLLSTSELPILPPAPEPTFMQAPLTNNPLTPETPYVVHLTARYDFGPVYSHRYFLCPEKLGEDWLELSLLEWFVAGVAFKMCAERWDLKCVKDNKFFRMTLRPNLAMRGCYVPWETREEAEKGRGKSIGDAECKGSSTER